MILTVLDTETTGLDSDIHEIIEVAAITYLLDKEGNPWGQYGIDLTDDAMHKPSGELHHNYTRAKKICDRRNKIHDGYFYVPSHSSLGEVDHYPGGRTGHRIITTSSIIYRIVAPTPSSQPVTMDNVYLEGIG